MPVVPAGEENGAEIVGLRQRQGRGRRGQQLLDGYAVRTEHDDFRSAAQSRKPLCPFGEFDVANDQPRIDFVHLRLDLAVGIGGIERRHLRAGGHAGIKPDHRVQAVAHHKHDALAAGAEFDECSRQRRHGLPVLTVGQLATETGDAWRIRPMLGRISERMDDRRKIRIARIALRRRHGGHERSYSSRAIKMQRFADRTAAPRTLADSS